MNRITHACEDFGCEINLKKTVIMHDPGPRLPNIKPAMYVEGKKFDVVLSFVNFGSTLAEGYSFNN